MILIDPKKVEFNIYNGLPHLLVPVVSDPKKAAGSLTWAVNEMERRYGLIEAVGVREIASFNEITKNAVKDSLKNPREIDMKLVDAQQARRMLDRMVGYRISPLLWAKIKRGLSAGRVQSVALRIICDREDEINAFIPEEYWTLDASLKIKGEKKPLVAKYHGIGDKRRRSPPKKRWTKS